MGEVLAGTINMGVISIHRVFKVIGLEVFTKEVNKNVKRQKFQKLSSKAIQN